MTATFALIGNPNTGKTSLFNELTGSYEYVGNWVGVTVEKKVGVLKDKSAQLVDLPGVYSLSPLSEDEGVATRFLLEEEYQGILNIVDASQLERNLYLTVQLLEYGKPLIIGLNMLDVAKSRGMEIDLSRLTTGLQVPIYPVIARKGTGCDQLSLALTQLKDKQEPLVLDYGKVLEEAIQQIGEKWTGKGLRWLALQFFEGNKMVREYLEAHIDPAFLQELYGETEKLVKAETGETSLPHWIRRVRSQWIKELCQEAVIHSAKKAVPFSEKIDHLVTHPLLGVPVFLLFMFLVFKMTFDWVGSPLSDILDGIITGPITTGLQWVLQAVGTSQFMQDLVLKGIVAGVGGVLVFVPQIFILFFFISLLEDSGYMARVAIVMDRVMEFFGLNGKAFIPMIIGFGCNVPGVMAARTIEQPGERLLTIILTPLMSCSARLSVYSLFVGAFFARNQAMVVFSLYFLGIGVALILARILSPFMNKGRASVFLVELPPYRFPKWLSLFRHTWEKGKGFVRKAGTYIFGGSVLIWLMSTTGPAGFQVRMTESYLAIIGGFISPLFSPLGFGTWQAGAALLTGFLAKEVVVSTMNILYMSGDMASLQGILVHAFTPLQAYSLMVFILLYIPCLATIAVIKKESGSAKWTWISIGISLVTAYLLTLVLYQVGLLLGIGT